MAETHWEQMEGSLDTAMVSWGKTTRAEAAPPEGAACGGFHSLQPCEGVSALISTEVGESMAPIPAGKGGAIQGCIRKMVLMHQYAPMLFLACGKNTASAQAYMLGLSEEWPYRIVLKKGLLVEGLQIADPVNTPTVLRVSDAIYDTSIWHNLQMFVAVNAQGDVALRVLRDVNDPIDPIPGNMDFQAIAGMGDVIDDALGTLTGTPGLTGSFFPGIGHYNRAAPGRISLFDLIMYGRQTAP